QQAFCLESDGTAVPISLKHYYHKTSTVAAAKANNNSNSKKQQQHVVMVHELAFGPDADPSVRGVALWFNIPSKDITEWSPQQAKRFRWKRTSKYNSSCNDNVYDKKKKVSAFDLRECFPMIRSQDKKAFDLATAILEHRFATVKAERLTVMGDRFESLKQLKRDRDALQEDFDCLKRDWIAWAYPINEGRQRFDMDAPVPPVDAKYNPVVDGTTVSSTTSLDDRSSQGEVVKGSAAQGIWQSFVDSMSSSEHGQQAWSTTPPKRKSSSRYRGRLPIFERLSRGEKICPDRTLPLISCSVVKKKRFGDLKPSEYVLQSERCWKSLLLFNSSDGDDKNGEWDMIQDHFLNFSRSKKVLSMIQQ
ncbi:MAG: hypothetical protein SGARI_000386, partial [Bacillariaceae sp.]